MRSTWKQRTIKLLFACWAILSVTTLAGCGEDQESNGNMISWQEKFEKRRQEEAERTRLRMVELDYAKAPEDLQRVAQKIANDQPLTQEELKALGPNIDKSFPNRREDGHYRYGRTLLLTAIENKNIDAVDALLKAGANPYSSVDPEHKSSQVRAWNFIYMALKHEGALLPPPNDDSFDKTFANELLKVYLKNGGDPKYRWSDGDTPLEFTVGSNFDGFKILIEAGADPWILGPHETPIAVYCVTSRGDAQCIQYLAEKGYYDKIPDIYIKDLIYAATNELEVGSRSIPEEIGRYYNEYGKYADAMKLVLERSQYRLPSGSKLYRLLYIDDALYRKKPLEKQDDN